MGTREDFISPEQLRVDRFGDYFTYLTYYSQSYNILLTHKFSSWLSDIIQVLSPVQAGTFKKLFFFIMKTTVLVMIMRVMRKKMVMRMILMFRMVRFCKKTLQVLSH